MKIPFFLPALFLPALPALALEVSNAGDSGGGSLRAAISGTPSGGTVTFNNSVDGATVALASTLSIPSGKTLTIDASNLTGGFTLNGGDARRILSQSGTATLINLTLRNGRTTAVDDHGGAISNTGSLTLQRCTFRFNNVEDAAGGAIENNGTLNASDCLFDQNNSNFLGGGAIDSFGGGTTVTLQRCTFTGNRANDNDQNLDGDGGGAIFSNGTLVATNCTFHGNLTNSGDGAAIKNEGTATLRHCTVSGNQAFGDGGGIDNAGTLTLENSIVSGNTASNFPDLKGASTDLGSNLIGGTVPALGAPAYNGGFVPTMLPPDGSSALDAAADLGTSPTTDARGLPRPGGGGNDIGAVERAPILVVDTSADEDDGISSGGISLRDAITSTIAEAQGITFDSDLSGDTITLGGTEILIDRDLTIDASALPGGITISGNSNGNGTLDAGESRIFQVTSGQVVLLRSLSLIGGQVSTTAGDNSSAGGAIFNQGQLTLEQCLVANCSARFGGGISNVGTATLTRSIVAGNPGGGDVFNVGILNDNGNNLLSGDPLLAPLGGYGGPTQTMPPLPGSPAIDAGGSTTDPADQRGLPRTVGTGTDIGAVEIQGTADTRSILAPLFNTDSDGDGNPFGIEFALGTAANVSDPAAMGNLSAPTFSNGEATLTFGLNPAAEPHIIWLLKRSTTLLPGSFVEIYRYDGTTMMETLGTGISTTGSTGTSFSITDENPPEGKAFYRFEAELAE